MEKTIKETYATPESTLSFRGAHPLIAKYGKKKTLDALQTLPSFTLHQPIRRKYPTRKYHCHRYADLYQADLIDMQFAIVQNHGQRYILTMIDC